MSVPFLRSAAAVSDYDKLIRFVRLHLGDGNEETGKREIDKSWIEAMKILLQDKPADEVFIERAMQYDEATLALLYFHLHFRLIRNSAEWIHDGSR